MNYNKREWKFNRKYAPQTHGIKVSDDLFSSITSGDTVICFLPEPHYMPDMGDRTYYKESVDAMKANAQLIAAAPALYEALKLTRNNLQTLSDAALHYKKTFSANLTALNQALAEVEGK